MQMTAVNTDDATAVAAVEPREFLNTLVWIKADGAGTAGTQSLIEILAPAGWETPWHNHLTHDEYFYILEGEVDRAGRRRARGAQARRLRLRPAWRPAWLPGLEVRPGAAAHDHRRPGLRRVRPRDERAGFRRHPAEPSEPDFERVVAAAAQHGMEILGPMPD